MVFGAGVGLFESCHALFFIIFCIQKSNCHIIFVQKSYESLLFIRKRCESLLFVQNSSYKIITFLDKNDINQYLKYTKKVTKRYFFIQKKIET